MTKFLDPDRHDKLIKLLSRSVPETRRECANWAVVWEVCSQLPSTVTAGWQTEVVERIEEMSAAAGWLAKGSGTQVVEFVETLWWARSMLLVGVGSWWLCVTRRQKARVKVATHAELFDTAGRVYV